MNKFFIKIKKVNYFSFFIIKILTISALCLLSCRKKNKDIILSPSESGTDKDLKSIAIQDEMHISVVGGDQWKTGVWLKTNDGAATWNNRKAESKSLNTVTNAPDGTQYAVGTNGLLMRRMLVPDTIGHCMYHLWSIMNGITFLNANECFMVGGEAYQRGSIVPYIYKGYWNRNGASTLFPQELRDITRINDSTLVAVGYGLVVRSTDYGINWKTLPVKNDFFLSVHFPTERIGYMIGHHGSILKTIDAGETWTYLRDGDRLVVSNQPFRRVFFKTETQGYIVGDKGLVWHTTDAGKYWETIESNTDKNLLDVKITSNGLGIIVGESGTILRFQD
jgi:photosystem II stability/assembly factor-like uncharacterized protein